MVHGIQKQRIEEFISSVSPITVLMAIYYAVGPLAHPLPTYIVTAIGQVPPIWNR